MLLIIEEYIKKQAQYISFEQDARTPYFEKPLKKKLLSSRYLVLGYTVYSLLVNHVNQIKNLKMYHVMELPPINATPNLLKVTCFQ